MFLRASKQACSSESYTDSVLASGALYIRKNVGIYHNNRSFYLEKI
jgi:hypothetical protein